MARIKMSGRNLGKSAALKYLADDWARDHPGGKIAWVTNGEVRITEVRGELVQDADGVWRLKNQTQGE
jgi:hypothetical protein